MYPLNIGGADTDLRAAAGEAAVWAGWWNKAFVFSSAAALPPGRVVYIDIDTVVVGDWGFLAHRAADTYTGDGVARAAGDVFCVLSAESMRTTEGTTCHAMSYHGVSYY